MTEPNPLEKFLQECDDFKKSERFQTMPDDLKKFFLQENAYVQGLMDELDELKIKASSKMGFKFNDKVCCGKKWDKKQADEK